MRRRGRRLAAAVLAIGAFGSLASLSPAPARAQGVIGSPLRPGDRAYIASYNVLSASPDDDQVSTTHVAPQLSAGIRVGGPFRLTADVATSYTSYRVEGQERRSSFRLGNPFVSLQAALIERPKQELRVGLGVAAPLATFPGTIPANTDAEYNYGVATSARGFGEHWLWAPNAIPVALLVHMRGELSVPVVLGAELAPMLLASVSSVPTRAALATSVFAGYRIGPLLPGLRLQHFARTEPLSARDPSQWAAAAFVDAELGSVFVRSQLNVNLDPPFGVAGQRGATVWGGALGAGVRL